MSNFIPINIVPNYKFKNKRPVWATPDFNPAIADKSFYETLAEGLSPQTQKQLLELQRQMNPQPQPQVAPIGVGGVQKDPRATIQLPNGQFVTPEQYQMLLQKLRQRS